MDAGKLDRRITIERFTTTRDAFNNPIETWAPLVTRTPAAKLDIRDSERWTAQEVGAEITTRFQIRYSSVVADVNPKDRVLYDGKTYGIVGVKEIGRRDGLEITAAARAD